MPSTSSRTHYSPVDVGCLYVKVCEMEEASTQGGSTGNGRGGEKGPSITCTMLENVVDADKSFGTLAV